MHPQSTQLPLPEETEEWRPVVDYEGLYEVSDLGNVRSVRRTTNTWPGRVLKPRLDHYGYLKVHLSRGDRETRLTIHRLVLAAFVGPFASGQEGNHINGVKTDNRLGNLEKVSGSQNTNHAWQSGLCNSHRPRGSQNPHVKLTEDAVRQIRALGDQLDQAELGRRFGVHFSTISDILRGKTWKHV